jgi:hypothetical protein
MIAGSIILGFMLGLFPGIVIGYRKGRAQVREDEITSSPVKPWGGIDAEHDSFIRD